MLEVEGLAIPLTLDERRIRVAILELLAWVAPVMEHPIRRNTRADDRQCAVLVWILQPMGGGGT